MDRALAPLLALLLLGAAPRAARAETPDSDPRAVAIADQVMEALGGRQRWDSLRGLRWTFQSVVGDTARPERRHAWDKHGGWYRVEGATRQGMAFCTIASLADTTAGHAWLGERAMAGDSMRTLTRRAKSLWTNDSYWLLMPYKLRDPGVRLAYDGEVREGDVVYDRLALSFDLVGETPGDRYWVFVRRGTHRIERWEYVLEGDQPPPERWTWEGWEQHDGLWFATIHRNGNRVIHTRAIETVGAFAPSTFSAR